MTEDEAKTKICHRSIDGDDSPAAVIANDMFAKKFACVGSKCMAWRWGEHSKTMIEEAAYRRDTDKKPFTGYCGLVGKP